MSILNHMLVGASLGLAVSNPFVAVVASLASHYVMDAMPHFGYKKAGFAEALRHRLTYLVVGTSAVFSVILTTILIQRAEWFALLCAVVAISPDAVGSLKYFVYQRNHRKLPTWIRMHAKKLHEPIQTAERPWWITVEVAFAGLMTTLVARML